MNGAPRIIANQGAQAFCPRPPQACEGPPNPIGTCRRSLGTVSEKQALTSGRGGKQNLTCMPTYVYESVNSGRNPKRYEIRQGINEPALTRHPESGEPIRRVVAGGAGILTSKAGHAADAAPPPMGHCCGRGGCCH